MCVANSRRGLCFGTADKLVNVGLVFSRDNPCSSARRNFLSAQSQRGLHARWRQPNIYCRSSSGFGHTDRFPGVLVQGGNPHPSARWPALLSEPLVTRARANVESVDLVGTRPSTTLRRSRQLEYGVCFSHIRYHGRVISVPFHSAITTDQNANDIKPGAMPCLWWKKQPS